MFFLAFLQLAYKADTEQTLHQYTMTKDEPLFRQAKANADLLSGVSLVHLNEVKLYIYQIIDPNICFVTSRIF